MTTPDAVTTLGAVTTPDAVTTLGAVTTPAAAPFRIVHPVPVCELVMALERHLAP